MDIHEFFSRFVSRDDNSVLFAALRRLSRMNDLRFLALEEMAWGIWPPVDGPSGEHLA